MGHIFRLPVEEPCREYALYVSKHGKGKPGRQQTLFLMSKFIQGDLNDILDQGQMSATFV